HRAASSRDDGQARLRRNCYIRKRRELETDWRDHRPRHCVACSGHGQKPSPNERPRCYVEPSVTVTPEAFYGALPLGSKGVKEQMNQHEVTVPQIALIAA